MRKTGICLLILSLLCLSLSGCHSKEVTPPTCQELVAAYEAAGLHTLHVDNDPDSDLNWVCYVKAWAEDEEDYIYFHFYETAEEAESYASERQWNVLLYLFSAIYGDATWLTTETCGNIEYEYDNKDLIKPFKELIA